MGRFLRQGVHFAWDVNDAKCIVVTGVSVCMSVPRRTPTLVHGPWCNLGNGRGCSLVVHHWADLQSVHGFRCNDSTAPNAKCQRVLLVLALCPVIRSNVDDSAADYARVCSATEKRRRPIYMRSRARARTGVKQAVFIKRDRSPACKCKPAEGLISREKARPTVPAPLPGLCGPPWCQITAEYIVQRAPHYAFSGARCSVPCTASARGDASCTLRALTMDSYASI